MIATISDELTGFVEKSVSSGRYASADAAVAAGLRLLQQTDRDHLRLLLAEADAAITRGEAMSIYNAADLRQLFDEIIAEGEQELASRSCGAVSHAN